MEENIQLSDLLESYPSSSIPLFQKMISGKKEFSTLASSKKERLPPGKKQFFNHQKMTHRFLRVYDDLLVMSETGTGKSCEILGFTEMVNDERLKELERPGTGDEKLAHFKRTVVILKGKTQQLEFKNQLVCACSDGKYLTAAVRNAEKESSQARAVTNAIKTFYEVTTYQTFAKKIRDYMAKGPQGLKALREDYSDSIFWIDEAHYLLTETSKGEGTDIHLRSDLPEEVEEQEAELERGTLTKELVYEALWTVFHGVDRSKRIVSTATPIVNFSGELSSLMNLILPQDGVLPEDYNYVAASDNDIKVFFPNLPKNIDRKTASRAIMEPYFKGQIPKDFDYMNATLDNLEPYFRGRISFVRSSQTGAIIEEMINDEVEQSVEEVEIDNMKFVSTTVTYQTIMEQFQNDAYEDAMYSSGGEGSGTNLRFAERQASNFVYPDGAWGNGLAPREQEAKKKIAEEKRRRKEAQKEEAQERRTALPKKFNLPSKKKVPTKREESDEESELFKTSKGKEQAFRRYVSVKGTDFSATEDFAEYLSDHENIKKSSCKFYNIAKHCVEDEGLTFIYSEFVEASGAITLALCLEAMGFERFTETESIFKEVKTKDSGKLRPFCQPAERNIEREVRSDFPPRTTLVKKGKLWMKKETGPLRYAILQSKADTLNRRILETMNSYENRYGDYIKVLISPKIGREGINVANVINTHLVGPEWNWSAMYQALSRGLRATSHKDLLDEERKRLLQQGENPDNAVINVKIYKHAAIPIEKPSSDLYMYRVAEYKDRQARRIIRMLKQCAIGCQIHYKRNVNATPTKKQRKKLLPYQEGVNGSDKDGSPECDYGVCIYDCVNNYPDEEDYSTYDVLYSDEIVTSVVVDIKNLFREKSRMSLSDIENSLSHYRKKYILMALTKMVSERIALSDRFGYTCYLHEDNSIFYIDRYNAFVSGSHLLGLYTEEMIGNVRRSMKKISSEMEKEERNELLSALMEMDPESPEFVAAIDAENVETQALLVEEVIKKKVEGNDEPYIDAIMNKYSNVIFSFNEPVTELKKIYDKRASGGAKRGPKPKGQSTGRVKALTKKSLEKLNLVYDDDTEVIYIHTLYSQIMNQTTYATISKMNKGEGMRVLKPSEIETGWREPTPDESQVYSIFIQMAMKEKKDVLGKKYGIYGFVTVEDKERDKEKKKSKGTSFHIANKNSESKQAALDNRKIRRGKICTDYSEIDLVKIMYELGIEEPSLNREYHENDREELAGAIGSGRSAPRGIRDEIIENSGNEWPFEKVRYFYKWMVAMSGGKSALCENIREHLIEIGSYIDYTGTGK